MNVLTTIEVIALREKYKDKHAWFVVRAIDRATEEVIDRTGYSGGDVGEALVRIAVYALAEADLCSDESRIERLSVTGNKLIDSYRQHAKEYGA